MKAYRKFVAIAGILSAASVASAQAAEESGGSSGRGWASFPNERHLVARLMGGAGLRLNDAYGAGLNTPAYVLADVHFLFVNVGMFHMGPTLGLNIGFQGSHAQATQFAIVPGWTALARFSRMFGAYARLGVPIVITGGVTETQPIPMNGHSDVIAPLNATTAVGTGVELGVGGAFYFLSGLAITAEINGGVYFGDSSYTFPYVGGAVGLMVDYELLP